MKQFGKILREARENQNKTLKECSEATKISKRFLEALEEENIDEFPGEAYLIGFLRVYSEYLGLNPNEMIELYKKQIKYEEPIPLEELTKPFTDTSWKKKVLIIGIIVIIFILGGIVLFFGINKNKKSISKNQIKKEKEVKIKNKESKVNNENVYKFQERKAVNKFKINDVISFIDIDNKPVLDIKILNINIENKNILVLIKELNKELELEVGDQINFDFNLDGNVDFALKYIDMETDGIVIDLERLTSVIPESREELNNFQVVKEYDKRMIVINIKVKGIVYLKYIADKEKSEEKLLRNDDSIRIVAKDSIELHLSNLKDVELYVNNKKINIGDSPVGFFYIKWIFDENNEKYKLIFEKKQ